jgi:hypothetical protein
MCKYCKLSLKDQAKLGLLLGFPKCCIKAFINKKDGWSRIIEQESLRTTPKFFNVNAKLYYYNNENDMVMCDECVLLYNTDKEAQLAKFKPSVGLEKALERLNLKNNFKN